MQPADPPPPFDAYATLAAHRIQPTAQRMAVATVLLEATHHPSAEEVHEAVNTTHARVSRATVYNTLNLFVEKGVCRSLALREGRVVYDPNMSKHHHLIDEAGRIFDLPWDAIEVTVKEPIEHYDIQGVEVVIRAQRREDIDTDGPTS